MQQKDFNDVVLAKIAETVRGPAWVQSVKGVYTAGFGRTIKYVGAKIGKVSSLLSRGVLFEMADMKRSDPSQYFEGRRERKNAQGEKD